MPRSTTQSDDMEVRLPEDGFMDSVEGWGVRRSQMVSDFFFAEIAIV